MCYSGKCQFESWYGDCTVGHHIKFAERYGYRACLIGRYPDSPETVEWINANGNIIKSVTRRYYKDKEEELKRFTI